jgi:ankyrin repeat protein
MSTFMKNAGQQGLWDYIDNGQIQQVVDAIIKDPKQLNYKTGLNEDTPLHVIAMKGDVAMMKAVLEIIDPKGLDVHNKAGDTPLMKSGAYGQADMAVLLMDSGADPNASNILQETLLMKTIKGRNQDDIRDSEKPAFDKIIETAIDRGANIAAKSSTGNTASDVADLFDDAKTMRLLDSKLAEQKAGTFKPATTAPKPVTSKFG